MSSPLLAWAIILIAGPVIFFAAWLWQRRSGDAGIVDVAWTCMVGCGGILHLSLGDGDITLRLLAIAMLGLWTLRLAGHILLRMLRDDEEDGRYQMLRSKWGHRAQAKMLGFFQLQALFVLLFLIPFAMIAYSPAAATWQIIAAPTLWLLAAVGNGLADRQLQRWRNNPAHHGRTCRAGLWGWSRHPNYFFEWILWLSYLLLLVHQPYALTIAAITPAVLLFLLLKVTGIPYTERCAVAKRGDDYRRYQQEVSAFIPWPSQTSPSPQEQAL
ncbi:MAG: DUF1295 domain-containing protein [Planctomycetota bacterium]|nr:MAG: DUF1295 domain-containing protein [Planctomycetota bacterium]